MLESLDTDAVYWHILADAYQMATQDIQFDGIGQQSGFRQDAIALRDAPLESAEAGNETWRSEPTPGLLVTPASRIVRRREDGTNKMDDTEYTVLFQIIDRGDSRFCQDQLRAHLRWCELISRGLHSRSLTAKKFGDGCPIISWTEETKVVDEAVYWRHEWFVRGVICHYIVREPRGLPK